MYVSSVAPHWAAVLQKPTITHLRRMLTLTMVAFDCHLAPRKQSQGATAQRDWMQPYASSGEICKAASNACLGATTYTTKCVKMLRRRHAGCRCIIATSRLGNVQAAHAHPVYPVTDYLKLPRVALVLSAVKGVLAEQHHVQHHPR